MKQWLKYRYEKTDWVTDVINITLILLTAIYVYHNG